METGLRIILCGDPPGRSGVDGCAELRDDAGQGDRGGVVAVTITATGADHSWWLVPLALTSRRRGERSEIRGGQQHGGQAGQGLCSLHGVLLVGSAVSLDGSAEATVPASYRLASITGQAPCICPGFSGIPGPEYPQHQDCRSNLAYWTNETDPETN